MSEAIETTVELTPAEQEKEAQDALVAGYNKVHGEPPAEKTVELEKEKEPAKSEETPAKTDAGPEEKPEPDPWAGIDPVIKKAFGLITTKLDALDRIDHRLKSAEGRIGAIQTGMEAARAAAKTGADTPTKAQVTDASQSTAKWDQLKTDFPDWAGALEERFAAQAATNQPVDVEALRKQLQTETLAAVSQFIPDIEHRAREYARIDSKHPDWEDDVYQRGEDGKTLVKDGNPVLSAAFSEWMNAQAPEIQALADSEKSKDAIRMLELFYEHTKTAAAKAAVEEKKTKRLAAVIQPKQAASGGPTILPDEAGLAIGYKKIKRLA